MIIYLYYMLKNQFIGEIKNLKEKFSKYPEEIKDRTDKIKILFRLPSVCNKPSVSFEFVSTTLVKVIIQ